MRLFLKGLGLSRYKVGTIPAKADIEAQETFKKKSYNPVWNKPKLVKEPSFLSMPPILSSQLSWGSSGQPFVYSSKPPLGDNDLTFLVP